MIDCKEAQKLILLKGSGELDPEKGELLRKHVSSCSDCAQYPETAESVATLMRQAMREHRPAPETVQSILSDAKKPVKLRFPRPLIYTAAAAALLLMVAGAWLTMQAEDSLSEAEKMHTIMGLVSEEDIEPLQDTANGKKQQIKQLAGHLLNIQGLAWEQESTDYPWPELYEGSDSTSLLLNRIPSSLQRTCG